MVEASAVGESIKVAAVFDGALRPVKFMWKGRVHHVKEITYTWQTRKGAEVIVHFSVTDGAALYEITYNQSTMRWSLDQVEA